MSKKIGIDIRCLCEKNRSGVGEYTYNLLDTIFQLDRENEYFLFYNSWKIINPPRWNFSNVHFCGFKFPSKILNTSLKFLRYPKIDELISKTPQLRSGNTEGGLDIFLIPNLNFISLSKGCKKIIIVHDISFEIYPKFFSLKSRLWHKVINPKKLYEDVNQIVAVSKNTARDVNSIYNIEKDKIKVVYPGVQRRDVSESDLTRVKQKYNLPKNFILYLGNVEPRKNIEGLIEAFKIFMDSRLRGNGKRTYGSGEGVYRNDKGGDENPHHCHPCEGRDPLKASEFHLIIAGSLGYKTKLHKNNRHKNIKFLGYIADEDKHALYKLAELFVFPSYYEGFGFPPLEAMGQGTPVISSISSSLVEIVGSAGLLVDPYNINELAWAINEMITNQKLRDEVVKKGYERIKMFEWEGAAKKILSSFRT